MSQSYPPPPQQGANPYGQQPPQGGNPFGQPQPGGFPQQGQQPGGFGGYPPPAPLPPARENMGLGILAGVVVMLAAAAAYGGIIRLTEHEIGYAAVGVGALIGLVIGKVGGRNAALPVFAAVLALAGIFLGQYFGEALIGAKLSGLSVTDLIFDHTKLVFDAWKADSDVLSVLFFAFGAVAAFGGAKRVAG
ncbi:hypothetical protein [Streptomyces sp. SPB162]|uniref:hypothetical protein n=1 Tax=Streptomyces sp. SPB162 TaxID=2940560 RepID=UPI00240710A2|nr:hypothetical protein [Streptomyces sp. SPB162]MDF9815098.1 hypothetical protein [Streptomyces sp. SPB162]